MAYGFVNAGVKNPIDDGAVGSGSTWSSEKINSALNGLSDSLSGMGQGLSQGISAIGARADDLQSQITATGSIAQAAQEGLAEAVTFREEISVTKQADFDACMGSGLYRVVITSPFGLDGTTEIQSGGGLLTVFRVNDVSALQLWLLVDEPNGYLQLYWRYLNTENFPVATTKFFRFNGGNY